MGDGIRMELACKHRAECRSYWPPETVVEAVQLHFAVEHDSDEIALDLIAVCPTDECGQEMTFVRARPTGGGAFHYYACPACGYEGRVKVNG